MYLFRPDPAPGILPILYFHAMARLGIEGLVLTEPQDSFVSVGAFDNVPHIIDLAFCAQAGLPVMRRETGGGPVLLGPGQVFYNLVVRRERQRVPGVVERAYRHLSAAPIAAYREFGIDTHYRPINDLVTCAGHKIAGQGAADIDGHFCFVGSVLRYFDVDLMCAALRLPAPVRPRVRAVMDANMSWIERETGRRPGTGEIADALARGFRALLGSLPEAPLPSEVIALAAALGEEFSGPEALELETRRRHPAVKIREGVYVYQGALRTAAGMLSIDTEVVDERIADVAFHGDVSVLADVDIATLVAALHHCRFETDALTDVISAHLQTHGATTALAQPLARALRGETDEG
jgi:lipoate-protein ligase A